MMPAIGGAGQPAPLVPLTVTTRCWDDPEPLVANIMSALARRLTELGPSELHAGRLVIVATSPSGERYTIEKRPGDVLVCVNGAHDWLLRRGIKPDACLFLDSTPELAAVFAPQQGINYLVASQCHPSTFDRLAGHNVVLWHARVPTETLGGIDIADLVSKHNRAVPVSYMIPGGGTAAIRWFSVGQFSGFRRFVAYGLDSSFDDGRRQVESFMPCAGDEIEVEYNGRMFRTSPALAAQAQDFDALYTRALNDCRIDVVGDGLIPWMCESLNRLKYGAPSKETT